MDIDSDPDNSPNSIYIYPIHSYASQRLNSNPSPNSNPPPKQSKFKSKYKTMQKKPRKSKDNSLKNFIVDDDEIEEVIAEGVTVAAKKYPELILDHKYDNEQLLYLVKWDDSSAKSWENAQTINDITLLTAYWEEWKRKRKRLNGHPSTQIERYHDSEYRIHEKSDDNEYDNDEYELINKYPNAVAYADPNTLINWNGEIDEIESIQHNDSDQLVAYVLWKSGLRSVHLLDELHEKAPRKMCEWYSTHLRFLDNSDLQQWY